MRHAHIALATFAALGLAACADDAPGAAAQADASATDASADASNDASNDDAADASADATVPLDDPTTSIVPLGFRTSWASLPHRLSWYELTLDHVADPDAATLVVRNDGGPFGALETSEAAYDLDVIRTAHLRAYPASLLIELPPSDAPDDGVEAVLTLDDADLVDATALVAVLRGFTIETDRYDEPPAFASDPTLPYDPSFGYTSQGFGISIGKPLIEGSAVSVPLRVRNLLGLSDRGDMNAAIPLATTWMRVDVTVIGVVGDGDVALAQVTYDIGNEGYGPDSALEHATPDQQQISFAGRPGIGSAAFAITGFDFWLNVDGQHGPDCVVVQDEINTWGEAISGPGRYIRDVTVRLGNTAYDAATGVGTASFDLHLSNDSTFKEVGNICLRAHGSATMLQFDDTTPTRCARQIVAAELPAATVNRIDESISAVDCP